MATTRKLVPTFRVGPSTNADDLARWLAQGPTYRHVEALVDHGRLVLFLLGKWPRRRLKKKVVYPLRPECSEHGGYALGPSRLLSAVSDGRASDATDHRLLERN